MKGQTLFYDVLNSEGSRTLDLDAVLSLQKLPRWLCKMHGFYVTQLYRLIYTCSQCRFTVSQSQGRYAQWLYFLMKLNEWNKLWINNIHFILSIKKK
jgi:hypothetical protein